MYFGLGYFLVSGTLVAGSRVAGSRVAGSRVVGSRVVGCRVGGTVVSVFFDLGVGLVSWCFFCLFFCLGHFEFSDLLSRRSLSTCAARCAVEAGEVSDVSRVSHAGKCLEEGGGAARSAVPCCGEGKVY